MTDKPMSAERLEELREGHKLRDSLTHDEVNELFAEIDRMRGRAAVARACALEEAARVALSQTRTYTDSRGCRITDGGTPLQIATAIRSLINEAADDPR